ncbi:MAG: transcription antitermination factor NusB [Firmicutes bacterium]|jgi:N utilization substance protein B|nr:transcription antitermination factor NusB [Bacillota bacterium]
MNRREAREYVMSQAFKIDAMDSFGEDPAKFLDKDELGKQYGYAKDIISKLLTDIDDIDAAINAVSDGWNTHRMAKTDLAIIRVACCEMMVREDVPKAVAINEAVELSKKYGSEHSGAFINAVLGKIDG